MSYCRFSEGKYGPLDEPSDVYMYPGAEIECVGCNLSFNSRTKAYEHLKNHVNAGDRVPSYAFRRLQQEIKDLGDKY